MNEYRRYIIGIDLGTTNSALAFVDCEAKAVSSRAPLWPIRLFSIPQLVAPGRVEALPSLPSFCYLPAADEFPAGALKLPWKEEASCFVGLFAKQQGARLPTRLIQSAKSWLSNGAVSRRDKILPLEAADPSHRLSPVEASTKYFLHIKEAWNALMAKENPSLVLEEQEVILTVPASFDEVARMLTVDAARQAGFLHITLLEEPQAAFYHWIAQNEEGWEKNFSAGDRILVCDIGGGTTDFSLIEIEKSNNALSFQRRAVGDHLLLGGDNIDAAVAHYVEKKLFDAGHPSLETHQWHQLKAEARTLKEELLQPGISPETSYTVVLQKGGSSVIKESLAVSICKKEVEECLLKGFFDLYSLDEALQLRKSRGVRTMGLPYEDDPSITKHLAHFLKQASLLPSEREKNHPEGITHILFNGGTLKPTLFQEALIRSLKHWFPHIPLQQLSSPHLDLAVAKGAAYYGKVRRGYGVAIGGGIPRTYYLKIEVNDDSQDADIRTDEKIITLFPRGSVEGDSFQPDQTFLLRPNIPVCFHLLTSHVRLNDRVGDIIAIDSAEMQPLPPIQTILRFGKKQERSHQETFIAVRLGVRLTAIGTLEMWLESQTSNHKWELEFQLRSASGQEPERHLPLPHSFSSLSDEKYEKGFLNEAFSAIETLFQSSGCIKPPQIMEILEEKISKNRSEWGLGILRELWTPLLKAAPQRKLSQEHQARWWNLAGYFLRPGFGFPLDDFRIRELWKIALAELSYPPNGNGLVQLWICFRRIAGGLNRGQQMQIANALIGPLLDKKTKKMELKRKEEIALYPEKIRALAAMERLDLSLKELIGEALLDRILHHTPAPYEYWALGRVGARHLLYGSAGQVLPKERVALWVEKLLHHLPHKENNEAMQSLMKQLARKTDDRTLNLPETTIQKILLTYPEAHLDEYLLNEKPLSQNEQEQLFGEHLPMGLILKG